MLSTNETHVTPSTTGLPDQQPYLAWINWDYQLRALRGFVSRKLKDEHTSDDIVQEAIQVALCSNFCSDRVRPGDPNAQFSAWLKGIARNRLRKYFKQRNNIHRLLERVQETVASHQSASSWPAQFDAEDLREVIALELNRSKPSDRQTLRMHLQGKSYAEIHSAIPDEKINTIHKRVSRFNFRLRRRLLLLAQSREVRTVFISTSQRALALRESCQKSFGEAT